jgi:hypothetical protein
LGSDVAQSFALNSIDLATQVWCHLLLFFEFYRVNFGEASVWRCFGLDPHDSFHLNYLFQIHFIISKELLKDLTTGLKVHYWKSLGSLPFLCSLEKLGAL